MLNAMSQGNDGSLSTIHANSSLEVFNRICTYAIQSAERLPADATMMLIAGAIDFVVFVERRNEFDSGGGLRRLVTSVREVNGVDGQVLSSEVFADGPDGVDRAGRPDQSPGRAARQPATSRDARGVGGSERHPAADRARRRRRRRRHRAARCARLRPVEERHRPVSRPAAAAPSPGSAPAARWRSARPARAGAHPLARPRRGRRPAGVLRPDAVRRRPLERDAPSPGSRAWPPGPSRCATRSPARSVSSRPSPPRRRPPLPRSATTWSTPRPTGCGSGRRCRSRCRTSPTTSTTPAPT